MKCWPAQRPDFNWRCCLHALSRCLWTPPRDRVQRDLDQLWRNEYTNLYTFNARAAFDLLLRTQAWPPASEIVFTGVNIPQLPEIARSHGLITVAVDVDTTSAMWEVDALREAINERTVAVVLVHLFGARQAISESVALAHEHGLLVVEDCAQAYAGPHYHGHKQADISLFSFGPMKTASALGGGIAVVRAHLLARDMTAHAELDPMQSTWRYVQRVLLYWLFNILLNPWIYGAIVAGLARFNVDHEAVIHRLTVNVPNTGWQTQFRLRPCTALLATLAARLAEQNRPIQPRINAAALLLSNVGARTHIPTRSLQPHSWWVFPVATPDPLTFKANLRKSGFDALNLRLAAVNNETHRLPGASTLANAVIVPCHSRMPRSEVIRLARLLDAEFGTTP